RVSEVPTPWMCLHHDLREQGIDPSRLDRAPDRSMASNLEALRNGQLDVAQLFEPYASMALQLGAGHILYAASARGPTVYTTFVATKSGIERHRDAFTGMTRAIRRMQGWLSQHDAEELTELTAPFFPDIARNILVSSLRRYGQAGIWARTPDMSRQGLTRLGESLLSGGFISRMPTYEDCLDQTLGCRWQTFCSGSRGMITTIRVRPRTSRVFLLGWRLASFRCRLVAFHRWARADEMPVAVDVVHPVDGAPVFVAQQPFDREARQRACIRAIPVFISEIENGMWCVLEDVVFAIHCLFLDRGNLRSNYTSGCASAVEFRLRLGFRRLDHQRAGPRKTHGRRVESVVDQPLRDVFDRDSGGVLERPRVDDALMRDAATRPLVKQRVVALEPLGNVIRVQDGSLSCGEGPHAARYDDRRARIR